jgi:hypothetical protein
MNVMAALLLDRGINTIIIVSGHNDKLRAQTQHRVFRCFPNGRAVKWLTDQGTKGDMTHQKKSLYNREKTQSKEVQEWVRQGKPVIAVVKKSLARLIMHVPFSKIFPMPTDASL